MIVDHRLKGCLLAPAAAGVRRTGWWLELHRPLGPVAPPPSRSALHPPSIQYPPAGRRRHQAGLLLVMMKDVMAQAHDYVSSPSVVGGLCRSDATIWWTQAACWDACRPCPAAARLLHQPPSPPLRQPSTELTQHQPACHIWRLVLGGRSGGRVHRLVMGRSFGSVLARPCARGDSSFGWLVLGFCAWHVARPDPERAPSHPSAATLLAVAWRGGRIHVAARPLWGWPASLSA